MARTRSAQDAIALAILAELSKDLLYLVHRRERVMRDPFRTALNHYRFLGDPPEIGGRWRQALVRDHDREVLRHLDRDLLLAFVPLAARPAIALPTVPAVSSIPVWPTTLVFAGPFSSVEQLDALTDAVVRLPGVLSASVALGGDGMAYVHVTHSEVVRLAAAIRPLLELAPTVIAGRPAQQLGATESSQAA